jgi:hypothetical protein
MPAKRTGTRKARAASRVKRTMKGGGWFGGSKKYALLTEPPTKKKLNKSDIGKPENLRPLTKTTINFTGSMNYPIVNRRLTNAGKDFKKQINTNMRPSNINLKNMLKAEHGNRTKEFPHPMNNPEAKVNSRYANEAKAMNQIIKSATYTFGINTKKLKELFTKRKQNESKAAANAIAAKNAADNAAYKASMRYLS